MVKATVKMTVRQIWGKVRRFGMYCVNREAIRRGHARRVGQCRRCGACCKLLYTCQGLIQHEDGTTSCRIHRWRPPNCRMFPVNEADLLDRDGVLPETPCGFSVRPAESDPPAKSRRKVN